jgi:hypothetical protein
MWRCLFLLVLTAGPFGQTNTGELRLTVTDQAGLPVQGAVQLVSESNQVRQNLETDPRGTLVAKRLPFGRYRVEVSRAGFATFAGLLDLQTALPTEYHVTLVIAPVHTHVSVGPDATLVDPHRTGAVNRIGSDTLQSRISALPGRSLPDVVNTQPGWLLAATASCTRGSEYQVQYVVDGSDYRQPVAILCAGNGTGRRALDEHPHRRLPGRVRPEAGA